MGSLPRSSWRLARATFAARSAARITRWSEPAQHRAVKPNESAPRRVRVNGCTFGGSAIKTDIVAAPGLFMEFDTLVCTTRIRAARLLRGEAPLQH